MQRHGADGLACDVPLEVACGYGLAPAVAIALAAACRITTGPASLAATTTTTTTMPALLTLLAAAAAALAAWALHVAVLAPLRNPLRRLPGPPAKWFFEWRHMAMTMECVSALPQSVSWC